MLGSALNIILPLALIFWLIRRSSGMMGVSRKHCVVDDLPVLQALDIVFVCNNKQVQPSLVDKALFTFVSTILIV